ncbi:MAG: aminotransferase class I/II-fold pyridoxal phosphate-dependent enzyme, partial [Acidimicrobiales bacterium]
YGDALIIAELAAAAETSFAADGIDATNVTITSGSMDAIERVLRAQGFRTGDRIGVEDPGHVPVHQVARSAGLELVPLPVDEHGITVDGLERGLDRGLAAAVITPRAQNPTGAALTAARAGELRAALDGHPDVVVIHDDHAGPIAGTPYIPVPTTGSRWATIRSVGKSYGPDLRLALVAGDGQTIDRLTTAIGNGPGWVSYLLQRAVARLLTDDATAELVAEAAVSYRVRRERLIGVLADFGVAAGGRSGVNVWVPTPDEQAAVEAARNAGFAIRAADPWRISSPPAVRITITNLTDDHIETIGRALGESLQGGRGAQQV